MTKNDDLRSVAVAELFELLEAQGKLVSAPTRRDLIHKIKPIIRFLKDEEISTSFYELKNNFDGPFQSTDDIYLKKFHALCLQKLKPCPR